ncbi:MAG: MBL fold metallo-hydrolase, partial [Bacteroidales bacterium]|nr:MBL fold metallo-hydrolase [Bacteroidales bacterium]
INIRLFQEGIRVGKDVTLTALKRTTPSEIFEFD